jgi:AcrR family transcriptional regulator
MSGEDRRPAHGLRERKKQKTKVTIQRIALGLFREQGYENTTIDQIAEAAEVSRPSVFRYFPTKADIVFDDIFDARLLQAYHSQPTNLNPVAALRLAIRTIYRAASLEELEFERQREALLRQAPELRTAISVFSMRALPILSAAIAERAKLSIEDLRVRTLAGAVIGVIISIWTTVRYDDNVNIMSFFLEQLDVGLKYLETDFPEL